MADFDSSDYLSYTGNTGYDPEADTSTDYGDTTGYFDKLFSGIGNLLGGKWGQLGAFLGLSALANKSSYFNQPPTRVGYQGTIPAYSFVRQQTPIAQQRPAGYRPGQGGVTYFTPGYYQDLGYDPVEGPEFLNPDMTVPSTPATPETQMAAGGYAFGGFSSEEGNRIYEDGGMFGGMEQEPLNISRTPNAPAPTTIDMSSPAAVVDTGDMFKKQTLGTTTGEGIASLPAVTSQQIFNVGKGLLQQGLDPQTLLNKLASQTGATQEQINQAAGWLGASGYTGLNVPGSKSTVMPVTERATADVGAPPVIPAPPSDYGAAQKQFVDPASQRVDETIWSGMGTFANDANITTQDILDIGRRMLQKGANPQDMLNQLAKNPSVTQATLNSAAAALGVSGYKGLTTPMTKFTGPSSGAISGGISTLPAGDKKTTMPVGSRAEADIGRKEPKTYGDIVVPNTGGKTVRELVAALDVEGKSPVTGISKAQLDLPINFYSQFVAQDIAANPAGADYIKWYAATRDKTNMPNLDMLAWAYNNPMPDLSKYQGRDRTLAYNNWLESSPMSMPIPHKYDTYEKWKAAYDEKFSKGDPRNRPQVDEKYLMNQYYGERGASGDPYSPTPPIVLASMADNTKENIRNGQILAKLNGQPYWGINEQGQWVRNGGDPNLIGKVYAQTVLPNNEFSTLYKVGGAPSTTPMGAPGTTAKPSSSDPVRKAYDLISQMSAARRAAPTARTGIGRLTPGTIARRRKVPGGAAGGDVTMLSAGGIDTLAKGRYLKGDGDGVSDSIDAKFVGSGQPAALADGEFVVPARVVSELGNGSSDAGARKLYAMLDRVEQRARKAKRGKPSGADHELKKLA